MAKKSFNKVNFAQLTNASNLNSDKEEDKVVWEIGKVILASKEKPKKKVFAFALSLISDPLLNRMMESIGNKQRDSHPATTAIMLLGMFLRQHLHGDKRGGFEATEDELFDIINTVIPYITIELVRRRQCFGVLELPESPWVYNATLHIREPRRDAIEKTVAELKALRVPVFPLLTDKTDLQRMEEQNVEVMVEMGVQGRGVATEEMINIQPHKASALDPKTFIEAFVDVNERAFGTSPVLAPALLAQMPAEVDIMDKKGSSHRLNISKMQNSPEGRMISILHDHFGDDQESERSAILRFYALMKMLREGTIAEWAKETPEMSTMHPAILITAATMKLTKGGGFPPAKFQQEVRRLIAEASKLKND